MRERDRKLQRDPDNPQPLSASIPESTQETSVVGRPQHFVSRWTPTFWVTRAIQLTSPSLDFPQGAGRKAIAQGMVGVKCIGSCGAGHTGSAQYLVPARATLVLTHPTLTAVAQCPASALVCLAAPGAAPACLANPSPQS